MSRLLVFAVMVSLLTVPIMGAEPIGWRTNGVGRYPDAKFVWLMGADNLVQIHRWRDWSRIFHTVPVAVFARPTYSLRAEQARAARRFARYRLPAFKGRRLAGQRPPAWVLFKRPHNPQSATRLRRGNQTKGDRSDNR